MGQAGGFSTTTVDAVIRRGQTCAGREFGYPLFVAPVPPSQRLALEYRPYRRPFARPLRAAWGTWAVREGILLRLQSVDEGTSGFGEIAPLPAFGSETLAEALAFLQSLPGETTAAALREAIGKAPPATAFGLWCALAAPPGLPGATPTRSAALLSLDSGTATQIQDLRPRGYRTFKLKTGLSCMEEDWHNLQRVTASLQEGEHLRLDPNQSWNKDAGGFWLQRLGSIAEWIEFIEEPFMEGLYPPAELVALAASSPVPLALDESLSRNGLDAWLQSGWPGFWVVKPSLMGDPGHWRQALEACRDRVIVSSVFETGIGLGRLSALAAGLNERDHGFGTGAFFGDAFGSDPDPGQEKRIWNHLPSA